MTRKYNYPSAVVFDLDYTLWPFWCDTHVSLPLTVKSKTSLVDSTGMELSFYRDVESIFEELKSQDVKIIGASRTATPFIAKELLMKLHINNTPAIKHFDSLQWGQGTKKKHISKAAKDLKLENELAKGSFILFDDELRNKDVQIINCYFAHIPDETLGLTRSIFETHLYRLTEKN